MSGWQVQAGDGYEVGDKVRVKSGDYRGLRGQVTRLLGNGLVEVNYVDGQLRETDSQTLTNYSLAARKAWATMPKRAGRPKGLTKKRMVSIRVEAEVWDAMEAAVAAGLIRSREEAVNELLRKAVQKLGLSVDTWGKGANEDV